MGHPDAARVGHVRGRHGDDGVETLHNHSVLETLYGEQWPPVAACLVEERALSDGLGHRVSGRQSHGDARDHASIPTASRMIPPCRICW